ncbi:MAG: hypothetical protein HUU49_02145 [Candidatus Buchananbacteria bacterium]|nr:hypothetical protein [Candidatus Buchananbacteria bacterium]
MNQKIKKKLPWIGVIVLVIILFVVLIINNNRPGELDSFARCISDSGAKFYGAFWCSACNSQKDLFGRSERLLPYVECSSSNGQSQTIVCQQAKIESYPTWEFNGQRQVGVMSLQALSEKTGCQL